jgi:hypothetical protein
VLFTTRPPLKIQSSASAAVISSNRNDPGSQGQRGCIMETSVVFSRLTNITWISIVKGK